MSADSIIPGQQDKAGTANPQELNRYSYVNNNPVKHTDPSGHVSHILDDTGGGGASGGGFVGEGGVGGGVEGEGVSAPEGVSSSAAENPLPPGSTMESDGVVHPTGMTEAEYITEARADGQTVRLKLSTEESWGNPTTLDRHVRDHGSDFDITDENEYASQASDFLQRSQQEGLPTKIEPQSGTIRVRDPNTNEFGSYNPDGTTKTYYKPQPRSLTNPRGHKYPTNEDYWNAQQGDEPWTP